MGRRIAEPRDSTPHYKRQHHLISALSPPLSLLLLLFLLSEIASYITFINSPQRRYCQCQHSEYLPAQRTSPHLTLSSRNPAVHQTPHEADHAHPTNSAQPRRPAKLETSPARQIQPASRLHTRRSYRIPINGLQAPRPPSRPPRQPAGSIAQPCLAPAARLTRRLTPRDKAAWISERVRGTWKIRIGAGADKQKCRQHAHSS